MQATIDPDGSHERGSHGSVALAIRQERSRLASDLHDEVLQSLFLARMECQWLSTHLGDAPDAVREKLQSLQGALNAMSSSLRRIVAGLNPAPLELGFEEAIRSLVRHFTASTGVPCELSMREDLEVGEPQASTAYRVVQEALHNVRKHAQARTVSVRIEERDGTLCVNVQDDGTGFDTTRHAGADSTGLRGMRDRMRALHGKLLVLSARDQGTTIQATLPATSSAGGRYGAPRVPPRAMRRGHPVEA